MPRVPGNYPAEWWGPDQDRDLMIGVCKHGYQQYVSECLTFNLNYRYPRIWRDPDLSFSKIIPQTIEEESSADVKHGDDGDSDNDEMDVDGPDDMADDHQAETSTSEKPAVAPALSNILNDSNQLPVRFSFLRLIINFYLVACSSSCRSYQLYNSRTQPGSLSSPDTH